MELKKREQLHDGIVNVMARLGWDIVTLPNRNQF